MVHAIRSWSTASRLAACALLFAPGCSCGSSDTAASSVSVGAAASSSSAGAGGAAGGAGGSGAGAGTATSGSSSGAAGSGGASPCVPGSVSVCYSGPPGTQDVGACRTGTAVCSDDGELGPCEGETTPAPEGCATPEDEDCDGDPGCSPLALCSRRFGGAGNDTATDVALDPQGNMILAGLFTSEIDFGGGTLISGGSSPSFVAKLDPDCNHVWSKMFGGTNNSSVVVASVTVDGDGNIILSGYFHGSADFGGGVLAGTGMAADAFLVKLDPQGDPIWSKRFGDFGEDQGICVSVDKDGNVLQALGMEGDADFGAGPVPNGPAYLAKIGPGGDLIWAKGFGGAGFRRPAADSAGNIVLAGRFQQTIDLGGGPLVSAGLGDLFLAKLGPAGDHLFSERFGDALEQYAGDCSAVAVGPGDAIAFTGRMFGAVDFGGGPLTAPVGDGAAFVARFDAMGSHLWSMAFGGAHGTSVGVDALGETVAAGYFGETVDMGGGPLTSAGLSDLFLGKLDPTGALLWSQRIGNAESQKTPLLRVASDQILLTAWFKGTLDLGNGPLVATDVDVLLAKLPPSSP